MSGMYAELWWVLRMYISLLSTWCICSHTSCTLPSDVSLALVGKHYVAAVCVAQAQQFYQALLFARKKTSVISHLNPTPIVQPVVTHLHCIVTLLVL